MLCRTIAIIAAILALLVNFKGAWLIAKIKKMESPNATLIRRVKLFALFLSIIILAVVLVVR